MADAALLQRVVMPLVHDPDVIPLYVDADHWGTMPLYEDPGEKAARRGFVREATDVAVLRLSDRAISDSLIGRDGFALPRGRRVSFGTYFNAFPASYWAKWTTLTGVRLSVTTSGAGQVLVYRSNARGIRQRVAGVAVSGESRTSEFDLPLGQFGDGGWYWFDLVAADTDLSLESAGWYAPDASTAPRTGTTSLAITTLDRAAFVIPLLASLAGDEDVLALIDRVYLVDQGRSHVRDAPGFADAEAALGGKLDVIEQANLGGSGGFSRGMLETLRAGRSDYVLLLDDDVAIEPEGIRRMLRFADFAKTPTIIGGHMFDMNDRSRLHAFAEGFDLTHFMWAATSPSRHDFASSNLRQTPWLHRRLDAEYTGWWMCLIPLAVVRELGLSVPAFIKWDDAEYGLRAAEHGVPVVSLPGSAVWHVSWVDKDDTIDWQAFYHARNRMLAALLHSPHPRGGRLLRSQFALDTKYLFAMQYFAEAARLEAYRSVLAGPDALHAELPTRLASVRALLDEYPDGRAIPFDGGAVRVPVRSAVEEGAWAPVEPPGGRAMLVWLARTLMRNVLRPARREQFTAPEAHLPSADARWWIIPRYDSVYVTNSEGSGVLWYRRDRPTFLRMMREAWSLRRRLRRAWPTLSAEYRAALPDVVSPETWSETFGLGPEGRPGR